MAKQNIPSYRLHKAWGLAVVRLDGKDFYLGKHGSPESRAEYDRVIAEWLINRRAALLAEPGLGPPPDLTIGELVDAFLAWADGYYVKNGKPTSEINCLNDAIRPLVRLYGLTRVADFGPLALKAVREDMVDADLSRRHINMRVHRIRRVFRWGVENPLGDRTQRAARDSAGAVRAAV